MSFGEVEGMSCAQQMGHTFLVILDGTGEDLFTRKCIWVA